MKTLNITIELPQRKTNLNVMNSIIYEAEEEKRMLEWTFKVNQEIAKKHYLVAIEYRKQLNDLLKVVGLRCEDSINSYGDTNKYTMPYFTLKIPSGGTYYVKIVGKSEKTEHSKYTTMNGEYKVVLVCNNSVWNDGGYIIHNVEEIIDRLKDALVKHYKSKL